MRKKIKIVEEVNNRDDAQAISNDKGKIVGDNEIFRNQSACTMIKLNLPRGEFDKIRINGRGHIETHNHTVESSQVEVEVEAQNTFEVKVEMMKTQNASEKLETKLITKKKSKHHIMHWLINTVIMVTLVEIGN